MALWLSLVKALVLYDGFNNKSLRQPEIPGSKQTFSRFGRVCEIPGRAITFKNSKKKPVFMTIAELVTNLSPIADSDPRSTIRSIAIFAARTYNRTKPDFLMVRSDYLSGVCSDLETATYFREQLAKEIGPKVSITKLGAGYYSSFSQFVAEDSGANPSVLEESLDPNQLGVIIKIELSS